MIKEVKIVGDRELIFALENFDQDLEILTEPLEKSARFMQQQAIANFRATGRIMSEGWPKLSPVTERYKERKWPGTPMMVRTGLLKSAFLIMGPRIRKDSGEIEVYNPTYYAKFHQSGTVKLPQRILLRFQKQLIQDITNIFIRWIDKTRNKNFSK